MVCKNCNREINYDKLLFCPFCGKKISSIKKCPKCGCDRIENSSFCPKCEYNFNKEKLINKILKLIKGEEDYYFGVKIHNILLFSERIIFILFSCLIFLFYSLNVFKIEMGSDLEDIEKFNNNLDVYSILAGKNEIIKPSDVKLLIVFAIIGLSISIFSFLISYFFKNKNLKYKKIQIEINDFNFYISFIHYIIMFVSGCIIIHNVSIYKDYFPFIKIGLCSKLIITFSVLFFMLNSIVFILRKILKYNYCPEKDIIDVFKKIYEYKMKRTKKNILIYELDIPIEPSKMEKPSCYYKKIMAYLHMKRLLIYFSFASILLFSFYSTLAINPWSNFGGKEIWLIVLILLMILLVLFLIPKRKNLLKKIKGEKTLKFVNAILIIENILMVVVSISFCFIYIGENEEYYFLWQWHYVIFILIFTSVYMYKSSKFRRELCFKFYGNYSPRRKDKTNYTEMMIKEEYLNYKNKIIEYKKNKKEIYFYNKKLNKYHRTIENLNQLILFDNDILFETLEYLATKNVVNAQIKVAQYYEDKNIEQSIYWYNSALKNNSKEAAYRLSQFYNNGNGVTQNKETYKELLFTASKLGSEEAIEALRRDYNYSFEINDNIQSIQTDFNCKLTKNQIISFSLVSTIYLILFILSLVGMNGKKILFSNFEMNIISSFWLLSIIPTYFVYLGVISPLKISIKFSKILVILGIILMLFLDVFVYINISKFSDSLKSTYDSSMFNIFSNYIIVITMNIFSKIGINVCYLLSIFRIKLPSLRESNKYHRKNNLFKIIINFIFSFLNLSKTLLIFKRKYPNVYPVVILIVFSFFCPLLSELSIFLIVMIIISYIVLFINSLYIISEYNVYEIYYEGYNRTLKYVCFYNGKEKYIDQNGVYFITEDNGKTFYKE
ncbi:MAG: hypothetical protein ACI35S_01660 [Anaeroplasma sp.]